MSHHLDSPIAREDVRLDITDLYVFKGETGTVFVINVCHSIAGDIPVPGYHPEGMYEFKIDLDGDAVEELTYRLTFDERDASGRQRFVLRSIKGADAVDPNATGSVVVQGVTGEAAATPAGLRVWAGKAGDPFWIEPDVLHAVGHAFQDGTPINLGDWTPSKAKNLFAGHTVYAIVLEVPDTELLDSAAGKRIGVWAVATLATDAGGWRSINRIGLPMIHPLFTQYNEDLGNRLDAGRPADDPRDLRRDDRQGDRWRRVGDRHGREPADLWREGGTSLPAQHPAVRNRYAGRIRLCRMERPVADRQRSRCHVFDRRQRSCSPRYWQRVGDVEAAGGVPVCSHDRMNPGCDPSGLCP